jgi:hypothetical protein
MEIIIILMGIGFVSLMIILHLMVKYKNRLKYFNFLIVFISEINDRGKIHPSMVVQ